MYLLYIRDYWYKSGLSNSIIFYGFWNIIIIIIYLTWLSKYYCFNFITLFLKLHDFILKNYYEIYSLNIDFILKNYYEIYSLNIDFILSLFYFCLF